MALEMDWGSCARALHVECVCRETLANPKLTRELINLVKSSGLSEGCGKEQGSLVMMVASTFPSAALSHRPVLMQYITDKKIVTNDQCSAAIKFFKALKDGQFDVAKFEKASGVGITVTDDEIAAAVSKALADNEADIKEQRYHFNFMKLLQPIKAIGDMAWADISKVKRELDTQSAAMLGPKTAYDEKPREKPKKTKVSKEPKVWYMSCSDYPRFAAVYPARAVFQSELHAIRVSAGRCSAW